MAEKIKKAIPCRRCKEFFAPQGDELYCKKCRIKIQRENKKRTNYEDI